VKKLIISCVVSFAFSACASIYGTPEERRQANAELPDYSLCEKLAVATLAPAEIRSEWAMELQQRGADCGQYSGMLYNAVQQNQRMMNMGFQMMQQPSYVPSDPSGGITCFKQSEWTSGVNRNCVYNCLGSETVQTIGATQLCPLSIMR
jgi:hypothetical protein